MIAMAQTEYESIADEALDDLRSEIPNSDVELKKISVRTGDSR